MKRSKYILLALGLAGAFASCDETSWLQEEALDFNAPDGSYTEASQYQLAMNRLYDRYRNFAWNLGDDDRQSLWWGDLSFGGYDWNPPAKYNDWDGWVTPYTGRSEMVWKPMYQIIGSANEIIYDAENVPNLLSEADKKMFVGEALFFRGLAYTRLANLYGGVPITLEPIKAPRLNFVRSTRTETYEQARTDLEGSVRLLEGHDIDKVKDGKISKQMAQHLLAEVYLCLERYQDAITAASAVIDHPATGLMTERFGTRKNEPGDVYWDLFRLDNQNRSSGNTEGLWVLQFDYQSAASPYSLAHSRQVVPGYWSAQVASAEDPTKKENAFRNSVNADGWTAEKGGRGIGSMRGTDFFFYQVWGGDFDRDIRNSSYNIQRDWRIDNPKAAGYGEYIIADGWWPLLEQENLLTGNKGPDGATYEPRIIFPSVQKFSRTGNYPVEAYVKNADGSLRTTALGEHVLANSGNPNLSYTSLKDEYAFRLAETYLLRAEAYLGGGRKDLAAADINVLRDRANATPVNADQVDIDYILDERMRELYYEEIRVFTLTRLGKFVERARKHNPFHASIADHMNLWPIPYGEIERNVLEKLEQNPGY